MNPDPGLHLDRLAGCVECIPPFMTCLGEILHGPAGGGRRGSPGSYGPGTRGYGPDPTIDSVARAISELPRGTYTELMTHGLMSDSEPEWDWRT